MSQESLPFDGKPAPPESPAPEPVASETAPSEAGALETREPEQHEPGPEDSALPPEPTHEPTDKTLDEVIVPANDATPEMVHAALLNEAAKAAGLTDAPEPDDETLAGAESAIPSIGPSNAPETNRDEAEIEDQDAENQDGESDSSGAVDLVGGLYVALSVLTRLPLGLRETPQAGTLARSMGTFPLVGVVVGGIGAAIYAATHQILPASISALLAVTATILVTGGLHEGGLADTADGFGGRADRAGKLAIMQESRIGAFGVLALILSVGLRAAVLTQIGSSLMVAGALVAAHAFARGAIPVAMQALLPLRADGVDAALPPSGMRTGIAVTLAVLVAALALPASVALAALAGATLGLIIMILLAQSQIDGHTDPVLSAVEQCAEILALVGALCAL